MVMYGPTPVRDDWKAQDIWTPAVAVIGFNFLAYFFAQLKKDNSIVDVLWGLLFVVANLVSLCVSGNWNERTILVFSLVTLWGLRLALHIGSRHSGSEDFRYQDMRARWNKKGTAYYYWAAFGYVFMMQAVFSLVINSSALLVSIWSTGEFFPLDVVGAVIFAFGFIFEVVADWQLQRFRNDPSNKGKIIKSGLWRYSRHPNYFGEAVVWWGIYVIACSVEFGWVTFFAPLFVTLLLRFVSGVPLLEKKYQSRPDFQEYMKETNIFIPWCPKVRNISGDEGEQPLLDKERIDKIKNE